MRERVYFKGLRMEEFIHPGEQEAKGILLSSAGYQKLVSMFSELVTTYQFTQRVGVYIKLSPETAPHLFQILTDVCAILDVATVPAVYMTHAYSQMLLPCGTAEPYLVISDYIAQHADREMLYYLFGNAIGMIKGDHVEITNITSCMTSNLWLTAPQLAIKKYLHLADATSDRAGLLACQSLSAAVRCHFLELGLPMAEVKRRFREDDLTEQYVVQYLANVQRVNQADTKLTKLAEKWMNLNYIEAPANEMLRELLQWYRQGYPQLLERYKKRQV